MKLRAKKIIGLLLMSCILLSGCEKDTVENEAGNGENSPAFLKDAVTYKYQINVDNVDLTKLKETVNIISDRLENYFTEYEVSYEDNIIIVQVDKKEASEEVADMVADIGSLCFIRQKNDQNENNYEISMTEDFVSSYQIVNEDIIDAITQGREDSCAEIILTGKDLASVSSDLNSNVYGNVDYILNLQFTEEGTLKFKDATEHAYQNYETIAIVYNQEVISAPSVSAVITDGKAVITGGFTKEEAEKLANILNCGELPYEIVRIQ